MDGVDDVSTCVAAPTTPLLLSLSPKPFHLIQ